MFYVSTLLVIVAIFYTEWQIPEGSSLLLRISIYVTGFVYWIAGASVYLYSSNHQSFGCLALNVAGLVLILSALDSSYVTFSWLRLIVQLTAILLPSLLIRSYLALSSLQSTVMRRVVYLFDITALLLSLIAVLGVYSGITGFSVIILTLISLELAVALVVLGGLWMKEDSVERRNQIRTVMFGSLIQFLVLFTLSTIGYSEGLAWLWPITSVILPLSVSLSILRGRFMDIELSRQFIYILLTAAISSTYLIIFYLISRGMPRSYHTVLSMLVIALLSICLIPLVRITHHLTDFVIYRDHYDFRGLLRQMIVAIPHMEDAEELGKYLCIHLTQALNLEWCTVAVLVSGEMKPIYATGFSDTGKIMDCLKVSSSSRRISLQVNQHQIGEIVFASKRSHMRLRPIDEDLLDTIAHHTAVVLDNYQLVQDLNARVQKLQETEAERSILYRRLLENEEEALARFSRELHDGALQSLFHLIRMSEIDSETPSSLLSEISELGRDIVLELREICADLRPHVLDQYPLPLALESLIERYQSHSNLAIDFQTISAGPSLPQQIDKKVEVMLYRVVQSALSNVLRHAQATSAEITLKYEINSIHLNISDNGVGFAVQESDLIRLSEGGHMGIVGMFERIRGINGTLRISRGEQRGTVVAVSVPRPADGMTHQSRRSLDLWEYV